MLFDAVLSNFKQDNTEAVPPAVELQLVQLFQRLRIGLV